MTSGTKAPREPFRIPPRRLLKIRLRRWTPLLVWLGVALIVVPLYLRQERGAAIPGFAAEIRCGVACETSGRVQRLEVALNQDVVRGQIVASLENDRLLLELQETRTELDRLTYELGREQALYELDASGQIVEQQTNLRRYSRDAANAHIEYLEALTLLAEDRIELQGLELTLNRTTRLDGSELVSRAALDADRIAYDALAAKIQGQETTVAELLQAFEAAEARNRKFVERFVTDPPDSELLLRPLRSAIEAQNIRIETASLAIARCVLRAPTGGRVVSIFKRPGEIVDAGEPILSILQPLATDLVAYLPESRLLDLEPGDEVRVRRTADPRRCFRCEVAELGACVQQMPARTAPSGFDPGWGIPVYIPLPASLNIKPGEAFEISLGK